MSSDSSTNTLTSTLDIVVSEGDVIDGNGKSLLTHLYFGDSENNAEDCLSIQTALELIDANLFAQYWFTEQQVEQHAFKNIQYAHTKEMLFGFVQLDCKIEDDLHNITSSAYKEIYNCLKETGFIHLLRTWNFFPHITAMDPLRPVQNCYETFCHGRLQAMQESCTDTTAYPAATVIGSYENKLQIYFLASNTPGIAVENPRQTSAFDYPVEDKKTQPLFSRGLLKNWGQRTHFYVSGTASILGHATLHIDDVCAQLNEAINNVETLVAHANDKHDAKLNAQDDLLYMKVYIRNREDVEQIKQVLAARLSNTTPRALLLGDMCRDDLLVEIEAFYQV